MTPTLAGALLLLALIDSTSFGTLLIPIWLMLAPGRVRVIRILVFLLTIATFYFGIGVAVFFGAEAVIERFGDSFDSRPVRIAAFLGGAALLAWSLLLERKAKREKKAGVTPGRFSTFRSRAVGAEAGSGVVPLMGLALLAGLVEIASMLPYLGAIGAISTSGITWPGSGVVLAAYCAVMVLPAVVLLVLRRAGARRIDPVLTRLDTWITRNSTNTLSWIVGIVGVVVMVNTGSSAFG